MIHPVLKMGDRITVAPVIHGRGDFAWEVRRMMLENEFDCVAVPLPPSFREPVERGIQQLPVPSIVIQESRGFGEFTEPDFDIEGLGSPEADSDAAPDPDQASYVPIDPCQPVIAALRTAIGEHIPRAYVDLETDRFEVYGQALPDPHVLKKVPLEKFAAAILPTIPRPTGEQRVQRITRMAANLKQLCLDYRSILFVCNIVDWPWIREAFQRRDTEIPENEPVEEARLYPVENRTLYFLLGELPFLTGLYEKARAELDSDEYLAIDGIKTLLLAARDAYQQEWKSRARKITPHLLATCLKYLRNLTLLDRRLTPDLPDIVLASQQVFGDQFALSVFESAREYPYRNESDSQAVRMGIDQCSLPDGNLLSLSNRLPGIPMVWRELSIQKKPEPEETRKWKQKWDPFRQCSWPPEDELIENFRQTVVDRAQSIMGQDLAQTEKFTSSIKDGIDIRDTLRHWYEGEIYVRVLPPNRGNLDAVVMLFDSPADPRDYPWRTTWFAEHENESTLAFYATRFADNPVGPGICLANYGGAMFLYPPRSIPDVWSDPRLDFTETLEERLLAAACLHSRSRTVALLAPAPPGAGWRKLARRFGKNWVHIPLSQFSASTIAQLRFVHVLNGHEVRSYAAQFIRRA